MPSEVCTLSLHSLRRWNGLSDSTHRGVVSLIGGWSHSGRSVCTQATCISILKDSCEVYLYIQYGWRCLAHVSETSGTVLLVSGGVREEGREVGGWH